MSNNIKSQKIIDLCEEYWAANKSNCSGFVKSVATSLDISLSGQANSIIKTIGRSPWTVLKSGVEANTQAGKGMFVVAGLEDSPNGHVVIVVSGTLEHGKYPTAYWGSLGGIGKKNKTINWSWNKSDRDKVVYAAIAIS